MLMAGFISTVHSLRVRLLTCIGFVCQSQYYYQARTLTLGYSAKPIHGCFFFPTPTFNNIPISITYVQGHYRRFEAMQILCTEC